MSGAPPLTRRRATALVLGSAALLAGAEPALAQAPKPKRNLALPSASSTCEEVQFGGDVASCQEGLCVLTGEAFLTCDNLKVWAEHIELRFTEEREFAGAVARGDALLVDGRTVVRCEQVTVEQDRIRGRVTDAVIRFKEGKRKDAQGVPVGRDGWVLEGDFRRPDADHLVVTDGTFTLCDCQGDPPSWRLDASEITVEREERATLWWPMLYINPFGLGLIPITPPGPPLSIPLQPRAWGFLPPKLTFFGPWPMVDVPFFIPMGDSWDLTVSAGLRTDWVRDHDLFRPSRWGAPRAAARLRYHPLPEIEGEVSVEWTWDQRNYIARQYLAINDKTELIADAQAALDAATDPVERRDLQRALDRLLLQQERVLEEGNKLTALEHRVLVQMRQRVDPTPELRWLTEVEWLSDDNIRRDFALALTEQVTNYVASRSQVLYGSRSLPVGVMGLLAVDYLLRTDNGQTSYLNTSETELQVPHRGPAVRATLLPWAPLASLDIGAIRGLQVEAEVHGSRYGPWDPAQPSGLAVAGGFVGAAWRDHLGPVAVEAFVEGHGLWASDDTDDTESSTGMGFMRMGTNARLTWAGHWGESVLHAITPRLEYVSIPASRRSDPAVSSALRRRGDEHLDVTVFHQAAAVLEQQWWHRNREVASLRLRAPFDLATATVLPLEAEASWRLPYVGSGRAWVEVDPRRSVEPVLDLGASVSVPIGPVTITGGYVRFSPLAEQFQRSIYELAGTELTLDGSPLDPTLFDGSQWVHAVTPGISLRLFGFMFSYSAVTLLPLPGEAPEPTPTSPARPFVNQHRATAAYRSPCDCWDLSVTGVIPGTGTEQDVVDGLRLLVTFSVGGYQIGSR